MKTINTYILEKFKISKNINTKPFHPIDKVDSWVFIVAIFKEDLDKDNSCFRLATFSEPIRVKKFENNILTTSELPHRVYKNLKVNSNNFYEQHINEQKINKYTLILPAEDGIKFFENFKRDSKRHIDKNFLEEYFDIEDEFFNDEFDIHCFLVDETIKLYIQNIKNAISK